MDPYYAYRISIEGDAQTVTVIPRFAGAADEKPISVNLSTTFPDTEEGQKAAVSFQEFLQFGTPLEMSGEFLTNFSITGLPGLGEIDKPQLMKFGSGGNQQFLPFDAELVVLKPNGLAAARLPIRFLRRTVGQIGVILYGEDRSGCLYVKLTVDASTQRVNTNIRYNTKDHHLPSEVLPPTRLAAAMRPPNMFKLVLEGKEMNQEAAVISEAILDDDRYVALLEQLARLQDHSQVYFPIPEGFSPEDQRDMEETVALLEGETITRSWTTFSLSVTRGALGNMVKLLNDKGEEALFLRSEMTMEIFDREIPIGDVMTQFKSASLSPEAFALSKEGGDPQEFVSVKMLAGSDGTMTRRLVRSADMSLGPSAMQAEAHLPIED